jgi:methionyl-tRNA formyltransferase
LKLIFAGTPPFAAEALRALHAAGHDIVLVLTQPDRPAGRGMKLTPSAVAVAAQELGLPVAKPSTLKNADAQAQLAAVGADVMVVAAYGLLLPQAVLDIPQRGCLNIHGSLLPRWRGAAPVQRAIQAGDKTTGIGIMQMEAGLDTGPVLLEKSIDIAADETSGTLFDRLTKLGAQCIVEALDKLDTLTPRIQPEAGVTYAHKITRAEAPIDWLRTAEEIDRQIRAFNPFPAAETSYDGETLKIWRALPGQGKGSPGEVLTIDATGPLIACGMGALRLQEVQRPGGKRLSAQDWARAAGLAPGQRLGT